MIEQFLLNLMSKAGLAPEHIATAYQTVLRWDGEIAAFKRGAQHVVGDMGARLDRIETAQRELAGQLAGIALILSQFRFLPQPDKPNGEDHERKSD